MRSDDHLMQVAAVLAMAVMALGVVSMVDCSDAADVEYDQDLGQFWSYTVQFVFNGSNAQSISWDFGDGSAPSTEFNPKHEFPAKGVYTVTQTTVNTMGETVEHYKVEIMGFPYITLVYDNGSENGIIQQAVYKVVAEKPVDPIKEGSTFTGWYLDQGCTISYDWSTLVTEPITLYAGWSVTHNVTFVFNNGTDNQVVPVGSDGKVQKPMDPVRSGYTFTGWYMDAGFSQVFDFDGKVGSSIILYAGWDVVSEPEGPGSDDGDKDSEKEGQMYLYVAVGTLAIAVVLVIAAFLSGMIYITIPAAALALIGVISGLMHGGLI